MEEDDSSEDGDIIDLMLEDEPFVSGIYSRYEKYKRNDVFFYVPVDAQCIDDKLKIETGDKSYCSLDDLKEIMGTWFVNAEDAVTFTDILWNNRDTNLSLSTTAPVLYSTMKSITVMILVEIAEYNMGAVVILPVDRKSLSDMKIVYRSEIGPFTRMNK